MAESGPVELLRDAKNANQKYNNDDELSIADLSGNITIEQLKASFPKERRKFVNQKLVDLVNEIERSGDYDGSVVERVISYSDILSSGRYKMRDYIKAVEYVVNYLQTESQSDAYVKTFPEKVAKRIKEGKTPYATGAPAMYYQGDLVQAVMARSMLSKRLLHYDKVDKAINTLYDVMLESKSDRSRIDAADRILTHLAEDPKSKIEMEVSIKKDESGSALEQKMLELAEMQQKAFQSGMKVTEIQKIGNRKDDDQDVIELEVTK